ncbi:MAG: TolB family protein, partial [Acidobacteriota bacterium]
MSALPPPPPLVRNGPSAHRVIAERVIGHRSQVEQVAVSPDGEHVAFVVSTIDLAENTTRRLVWIDGAPVTAGPDDRGPAWSPDGRFLAFTSRLGDQGERALRVLPAGTVGEVRTVCTMPDGVDDVAWSPDGRWIAFTSRTRHERYQAKDASWQSPRK